MLSRTERDGYVIYTTDDPQRVTLAVVEGPEGAVLVDTVEATYTESEGVVYDREDFLETVLRYYRDGRGKPVQNAEVALQDEHVT